MLSIALVLFARASLALSSSATQIPASTCALGEEMCVEALDLEPKTEMEAEREDEAESKLAEVRLLQTKLLILPSDAGVAAAGQVAEDDSEKTGPSAASTFAGLDAGPQQQPLIAGLDAGPQQQPIHPNTASQPQPIQPSQVDHQSAPTGRQQPTHKWAQTMKKRWTPQERDRRRNASILVSSDRAAHRIVGGENADVGEFPHMVVVTRGVGGSLMCGGSLVNRWWVVTTGQCCDGMTYDRLGVTVGEYDRNVDEGSEKNIGVSKMILHPGYDSWTVSNDICLLMLEEEPDFSSPVIGSIALPADMEEFEEGMDCVVVGWGTTLEGGHLAHILQKVTVPIVSDDHCRDSYGQADIFDSMICGGLEQGGKDACAADTGGPLMCGNQLSGLVSWGYGCAEAGYPGVYTQVSYFVDWINHHIN